MGRGPNKPGTSGARFTDERKAIYLAALQRTGLRPVACREVNVNRATVWQHRRRDPEFAEAEERALAVFRMPIAEEIRRRAIEGVERPVFHRGKEIGSIREYSDRLLLELAKAHIPEYRPNFKFEQQTEHAGSLAPEADLSKLSPRGQELLRQIVETEIVDEEEEPAA